MSHAATNWAVKQRGIPNAAKVVLWHLADRHNPDHGCFPEQATLASDCEMSRSSLNNQLNALEEVGLLRRQRRIDPITWQRRSTRYYLAFEPDFDSGNPCPNPGQVQNMDTEAMSKSEPKPCPNLSESHVQNLDTNPVRVTSKRTSNDQTAPSAPSFSEFWDVWPLARQAKEGAQKNWRKLSPEDKRLAIAKAVPWAASWQRTYPGANPIHPGTYLSQRRWNDTFTEQTRQGRWGKL